ncbi:hypothetical protein NUW54_g6784 [Trametes sanguinea]|uniref:Uncharacterized protein n=1 Tax=Trametes sanguinea TaxID=158606 RepID=A0ACC1PTD8_9APHY|nr:hypothetical protein NUW54_g6784 [Trametes sanguinea]
MKPILIDRYELWQASQRPTPGSSRASSTDPGLSREEIARYNGRTSDLTVEDLVAAGNALGVHHGPHQGPIRDAETRVVDKPTHIPMGLASRGAQFGDSSYSITYRNQVILGVVGVPGAFLAGWAVEQPYVGRKGTLAISAGE